MKIMLLGDCHGYEVFTTGAIKFCAANQIDRIVQVGDFGYWPRTSSGRDFIYSVARDSHELGVPLYFIDGNHEDHDTLHEQPLFGDQFVPIVSRANTSRAIWYIPRGTRFEWEGTTFGAFGGAYSIDRDTRREGWDWFPQEMPDEEKIESLGQVAVLLTHDSPIVPPCKLASGNFISTEQSMLSQFTVLKALRATRARLLVHGHWHVNERYVSAGVPVQGLDCNFAGLYDAAVVFDTETQILYTIQEWLYRG